MTSAGNICYLCGKLIPGGEMSRDHVPPLQVFPRTFRPELSKLITLPTHRRCNESYRSDEDYTVTALSSGAADSFTGKALWGDVVARLRKPEKKGLARKIVSEFSKVSPAGLVYPGLSHKSFDGVRVGRILWKIARGLFYHHTGRILPETTPCAMDFAAPGFPLPDVFSLVANEPEHGEYKGAFAYRYKSFPEIDNAHFWAFLLWDRIIATVCFHDPDCACDLCKSDP